MIYTVTLNPAVDRELVVPAITFDTVLRAVEWRVDCGGKGFNVSRMLSALGTTSVALGFAGGDSGRLLENGLHALGIETDFDWVEGETRTNVSIVTEKHDHYVKVNEPGPTIHDQDQLNLLGRVSRRARPGDWWVLSGSLPPGVPANFYAEIIGRVREAGGQAILDVGGEALRLGCGAGPYLVKPNEVEAHSLTGMAVDTPTQIAAAATAIQALGAANVAVSLGKKGALLVEGAQVRVLASPVIAERNPIGAGDSLVGGLVWGLNEGLGLLEALRWGLACGAATASRSGTAVGDRQQVEALLPEVKVSLLTD